MTTLSFLEPKVKAVKVGLDDKFRMCERMASSDSSLDVTSLRLTKIVSLKLVFFNTHFQLL